MSAFFIALPSAYAQTVDGHFVFISQGILSATSTQVNPAASLVTYSIFVGNGYQGTSTGAYMAAKTSAGFGAQSFQLDVEQYSDAGYSSGVGDCQWRNDNQSGAVDGFVQATTLFASSGQGCVLSPGNYVRLVYTGASNLPFSNPSSVVKWIYGANVNSRSWSYCYPASAYTDCHDTSSSTFFPMFAVVGDGFQITPTASSTGLFLSGAQEFCNAEFGSSTSVGSYIGQGICISVGYLFVPTPQSLVQFGGLSDSLKLVLPFSYFYNVADIMSGLQASSTQNFPVFSFGMSQIDFSSSTSMGSILPTNLEFLGTTTINRFLPAGMHDLLYNLMIFAIWLEVAWVLYHKVVPTKARI